MLIDPTTAMSLATERLDDLRREAVAHSTRRALHRQTSHIVPAWRRTAGRLLHRAAHALLATPRAGAPSTPAPTPCDDAVVAL
jgi:hypothetical protein